MTRYRFTVGELHAFLKAIDERLESQFRVVVVGGAAALLHLRVDLPTPDIDTASSVSAIQKHCDAARKATGLQIVVEYCGIHDGPWGYESRLRRADTPKLRKLIVMVPEKHDWALMKII